MPVIPDDTAVVIGQEVEPAVTPRKSGVAGQVDSLQSSSKDQQVHAALAGLELAQKSIAEAVQTIQEQLAYQTENRPEEHAARQAGSEMEGFEGDAQSRKKQLADNMSPSGQEMRDSTSEASSRGRRATIRQFRGSVAMDTSVWASSGVADGPAPRLPTDWPTSLRVRKVANEADRESLSSGLASAMSEAFGSNGDVVGRLSSSESLSVNKSTWCGRCWVEPDSVTDQLCNVPRIVALLFDILVMPVMLAWDLPFEGILVELAWVSLAFWALDLVLPFFRGFLEDGELNMTMRAAARRYVRMWFVPNLVVVSCDFAGLLMLQWTESGTSSGMSLRMARFAKMGRMVRIMGLLKAFRAVHAIEATVNRFASEMQRAVLQLLTLVVSWLWLNHVLACAWYAIGSYAPSDTGARWVERAFLEEMADVRYADAGRLFQYSTAIHWAIAQTTLGAMEIASVNTSERMFNILCLLFGLVFGSLFISSLSAGMVEIRMSTKSRKESMTTLHRYMRENNINKQVVRLVVNQAESRLRDTAQLVADDVPALAILAGGMRQKLHREICQPHLERHQLLQLWQEMDGQWFQQFCYKAVEQKFLRTEDDLFLPGSESAAAYFIISGRMEYSQVPESSPVSEWTTSTVEHDVWLCESTLWVHWIHVGMMEATTSCQILAIQMEGFAMAMLEHAAIRSLAFEYGRIFAERVTSAKPPEVAWPDDLEVPFAGFEDMVVALSADCQIMIGFLALNMCKKTLQRLWHTHSNSALRQEIEDGRSIVILSLTGELQRVVALAVLRIIREDGRVLVQLAKWEEGQAKPDVQLPATKCKRNESSVAAAQRYVAVELAPYLEGTGNFHVEDREVTEQFSANFGVYTHYMRNIISAKFAGIWFAPLCEEEVAHRASGPGSRHRPGMLEFLEVHFIHRGEGGMFCAWLEADEIQSMKKFSSSTDFKKWLSTLSPPEIPERPQATDFSLQSCQL